MFRDSRRGFLKKAGIGSAGLSALAWNGALNAAGSNSRIVLGVIGCGGQGRNLARRFAALPKAKVAYVCDPDSKRRDKVKEETQSP